MVEKKELKIKNLRNIHLEVVQALEPFKEREKLSVEFIVEGEKENPIVGIRYPGRKVMPRKKGIIKWGNLYDFLVVPYENGKEIREQDFTFENLLRDFEENKRDNEEFWTCMEGIYYENYLKKEPPKLPGIDSKLFLLVLKWIWIQEDFNYKYGWDEVGSPTKYMLLNKKGNRTGKGAGRAKFFAALILLKHHFSFEEVKKIIPMYA